MVAINDNPPEEEAGEEEELAFDFCSDDGAKRLNEALDEGSAHVRAGDYLPDAPESYLEEEECE